MSDKVIVIGVPRSGTTLLASMLGGHPDISMMDECKTWDWRDKQLGTRYVGNKIACDGITIQWDKKRVPIFGAIVNRLMNLRRKQQIRRWSPLYNFSLSEVDRKTKVIVIIRNRDDVINSIMSRSNASEQLAKRKRDRGSKLIADFLIDRAFRNTLFVSYYSLLSNTDEELKGVCDFLEIDRCIQWMRNGSKHNLRYGRKIK